MIVAFLVLIACVGDECGSYDQERWDAPTPAELVECAERAELHRSRGQQSSCELVLAEA